MKWYEKLGIKLDTKEGIKTIIGLCPMDDCGEYIENCGEYPCEDCLVDFLFSEVLEEEEEVSDKDDYFRWHDLRKDLNDLPKENNKEYLCIKNDFRYDFFEFNTEYNCFGYMVSMTHDELDSCPTESWFESTDEEIIAWKYIEPFEDEV